MALSFCFDKIKLVIEAYSRPSTKFRNSKSCSKLSHLVEFIVENNVEYVYLTKYSTMNPTIFNNGMNMKIAIYSIE